MYKRRSEHIFKLFVLNVIFSMIDVKWDVCGFWSLVLGPSVHLTACHVDCGFFYENQLRKYWHSMPWDVTYID